MNDLDEDTKPRRTARSSLVATPHHDLWFSDGSIVLQADTTLFRVHISWLCRHSLVFRDMFSMPQPSSVEVKPDLPSELLPSGCQFMRLEDTAEDLANLLTAIYDGPSFGNNDRADFHVLSGVLRLATKYAVDELRRKAIEHLGIAWPSTLKGWDAREEAARTSEAEAGIQRRLRYPSPFVRSFFEDENLTNLDAVFRRSSI